jgi:hypothetical protein
MTFLRAWMWEWYSGLDEYQNRAARRHQILVVWMTYCKIDSAKITGCLWEWYLCSFERLLVNSRLQNGLERHCRRPSILEALSRLYWHSNSLIITRQSVAFSSNTYSGTLHSNDQSAATFTWVFVLFTPWLLLTDTSINKWIKANTHRVLESHARRGYTSGNNKLHAHHHERRVIVLIWIFPWLHIEYIIWKCARNGLTGD